MAGKTQTPPAQTQAEIVAALRAQNAKTNSAVWNAVKRVPGLIAGAGVDTANLLLGALAGRGLQGLSKKPVGGSESINEAFGLKKSDNATQNAVEAGAGMMSPGGAAKAIIIPFSTAMAKNVGISKIADDAIRTYQKTGNNIKVAQQSQAALDAAKNPEYIQSLYVGPDAKLRAVVSNAPAQITKDTELVRLIDRNNPSKWISPRDKNAVSVGPRLINNEEVYAQEILKHPTLFNLVPGLGDVQVKHNEMLNIFGHAGSYSPSLNAINLPTVSRPSKALINDPMEEFLRSMLHELTHPAQMLGGTRTGVGNTVNEIRRSYDEAIQLGTYRTSPEMLALDDIIKQLETNTRPKKSKLTPEELIDRLYRQSYGEWEAEFGAKMAPRTLPPMYERGLTY